MLATLFLGDDDTTNDTDPMTQPNVDDNRLDPVKLDTLKALLGVKGKGYSDPLDQTGEQFVIPISAKLVAALAVLDAKKRPGIAKKWADTEEWRIEGAPAAQLDKLLGQIVKLAKQSVEDDRPMFLWMSV